MTAFEDPIAWFQSWYDDAKAKEPDVPDAMALATVGPDGRPSLRMVLMKSFDANGIVFYTNLGSRKARELGANPHAAVTFHWKSLQRQVFAEGVVERVCDAEADAYFATRPRGSQLGAWASKQSTPLASREKLYARVAVAALRFVGRGVTRPAHWGGFRIRVERMEFWQGYADRLHERTEFVRTESGWRRGLLYP